MLNLELIGERFKQVRIAKGLTQEHLAELVTGLANNYPVSRLESGNVTNIIALENYAKALDTPLEYFLTGVLPDLSKSLDDYKNAQRNARVHNKELSPEVNRIFPTYYNNLMTSRRNLMKYFALAGDGDYPVPVLGYEPDDKGKIISAPLRASNQNYAVLSASNEKYHSHILFPNVDNAIERGKNIVIMSKSLTHEDLVKLKEKLMRKSYRVKFFRYEDDKTLDTKEFANSIYSLDFSEKLAVIAVSDDDYFLENFCYRITNKLTYFSIDDNSDPARLVQLPSNDSNAVVFVDNFLLNHYSGEFTHFFKISRAFNITVFIRLSDLKKRLVYHDRLIQKILSGSSALIVLDKTKNEKSFYKFFFSEFFRLSSEGRKWTDAFDVDYSDDEHVIILPLRNNSFVVRSVPQPQSN